MLAVDLPEPPPDDKDHESFVRRVMPLLLGRRARGIEEIEVYADLAELLGREGVVRAITADPDFVHHWTDVITDRLRVQRDGTRSQTESCFGPPSRGTNGRAALDGGALARWVWQTPPAPEIQHSRGPFNMADLIASAIEDDDLGPVYKAYLFPLQMRPGREFLADREKAERVLRAVNHDYLTRDFNCLGCHNESETSITGANYPDAEKGWDRTHPPILGLDTAVFGLFSGPSSDNSSSSVFRPDVRNPEGDTSGRIDPWGIVESCLSSNNPGGNFRGFRLPADDANWAADFAGLSGTAVSVFSLSEALKTGRETLAAEPLLTDEHWRKAARNPRRWWLNDRRSRYTSDERLTIKNYQRIRGRSPNSPSPALVPHVAI